MTELKDADEFLNKAVVEDLYGRIVKANIMMDELFKMMREVNRIECHRVVNELIEIRLVLLGQE